MSWESTLAKYLAKAKLAGAAGKGAVESIPGLMQANPKASAALAGLGGAGIGAGIGHEMGQEDPEEEELEALLGRHSHRHGMR